MKFLHLLCAAAFLTAAACSNPREKALRTLQTIGAENLRHDAARLYVTFFAEHGTDFLVVQNTQYPPSFKKFAPLRVGGYPDGFSITLRSNSTEEAGLYVVPAQMDHVPTSGLAAHFDRLAEGVYWYSFGL